MNNRYAVTDNRNDRELVEIPHYAPFSDLTRDYDMPAKLMSFEAGLERMCREFIRKSSPDRNNGSYFDAVIQKYCDEAICDIDLQRQEHIRLFSRSLAGSRKGIRVKIEAKLASTVDELEEVEKELAGYTHIYYKGTSLAQPVSE